MKKIFIVVIVINLLLVFHGDLFAASAEADSCYALFAAGAGEYNVKIDSDPLGAALIANGALNHFKALSYENKKAIVAKLGLKNDDDFCKTMQESFIDKAYQKAWDKCVKQYCDLAGQKKYAEAKQLVEGVQTALKDPGKFLPGISKSLVEEYTKITDAGLSQTQSIQNSSEEIDTFMKYYSAGINDKALVTAAKIKDEINDAAKGEEKAKAIIAALGSNDIKDTASLKKSIDDVINSTVKAYGESKAKEYEELSKQGKFSEAKELVSNMSQFFKDNPQIKAVSDKIFNCDSVMICEKLSNDSNVNNVMSQSGKLAALISKDFEAACQEYNKLIAVKDYLAAAKLSEKWMNEFKNEQLYGSIDKIANKPGFQKEMVSGCESALKSVLITELSEARDEYVKAFGTGDFAKAKALAEGAFKIFQDYPKYKEAINNSLGGDWEQIAQNAVKECEAAQKQADAVTEAKGKLVEETAKSLEEAYKSMAVTYDILVKAGKSKEAEAIKEIIAEYVKNNPAVGLKLEKNTNLSLEKLGIKMETQNAQSAAEGSKTGTAEVSASKQGDMKVDDGKPSDVSNETQTPFTSGGGSDK